MVERLCEKCRNVLLEILAGLQDRLMGPGNGSGELPLERDEDPRQAAYTAWQEAYRGRRPTWVQADWVSLSKAVKLLGDDFLPTWERYLKETEAFYKGHSPRKFLKDADRWRPGPRKRRAWQPGDPFT